MDFFQVSASDLMNRPSLIIFLPCCHWRWSGQSAVTCLSFKQTEGARGCNECSVGFSIHGTVFYARYHTLFGRNREAEGLTGLLTVAGKEDGQRVSVLIKCRVRVANACRTPFAHKHELSLLSEEPPRIGLSATDSGHRFSCPVILAQPLHFPHHVFNRESRGGSLCGALNRTQRFVETPTHQACGESPGKASRSSNFASTLCHLSSLVCAPLHFRVTAGPIVYTAARGGCEVRKRCFMNFPCGFH